MKKKFFSNLRLYSNIYEAGAMISLSNEKHLKLVIRNVGWRFVILSFLRTRDTSRIRSLHNFAVHLIKMRNAHGDMYVIKYLKATQLAIQKKIAGSPFSSFRELEPDLPLPRLTKSGLPYIIKLGDRSAIVRGSLRVIRFWLSLSSLYRVLKGDFKPKLNTITDPFTGDQKVVDDFKRFLWLNSRRLLGSFQVNFDLAQLKSDRLLPIMKSSPSSKVSIFGIHLDILLLEESKIWSSIMEYIKITNSKGLRRVISLSRYSRDKEPNLVSSFLNSNIKESATLGQLAFKEEAAGKLRVFAMVDVFTQSLLHPLHVWLFDIFKKMPNDGTHDQSKAFDYAKDLANKYGSSYGYDLSSATDRLPVDVQSYFLNVVFRSHIGHLWKDILIGREYSILLNKYSIPAGAIYYRVGQPMGALSSWAMLNMIHHMMVQYSVFKAYGYQPTWYKDYVVLGDDIVIFDSLVARSYLSLCQGLGVSINTTKSVVAVDRPVVEFAKRTSLNGNDVSALSFKEFISNNNFFGRLSVAIKIIDRSWGINYPLMFRLASLESNTKVRLSYPIIGYLTTLVTRGKLSMENLISLLVNSEKPLSYFGAKLDSFDKPRALEMFNNILKNPNGILTVSMPNLWFAASKKQQYKIAMFEEAKRIFSMISVVTYGEKCASEFEKILKGGVASKQLYADHTWKPHLMDLLLLGNKFRWASFPGFYTSETWTSMTLDEVSQLLTDVQSLKTSFEFYNIPVTRRKELANPIKILEFIRNSADSKIQKIVQENPVMSFPTNIFPMFLLKK